MTQKLICKCTICQVRDIDRNKMIEGVDYIKHGTHYYHTTCYNDWMANKDNVHTDNASDTMWKDATYEYLTKDVKIGIQDKFFSQWKRYIESQKYTAKGIYFAIRYFYEIKKGDKDKSGGGIGIIPYIYQDSRQYWSEQEHNQKGIIARIEQQIREQQQRKVKVIVHKVQPRTLNIDFDSVEEMGDDE